MNGIRTRWRHDGFAGIIRQSAAGPGGRTATEKGAAGTRLALAGRRPDRGVERSLGDHARGAVVACHASALAATIVPTDAGGRLGRVSGRVARTYSRRLAALPAPCMERAARVRRV